MPQITPILCIPRLHINTTKEYIKNIIEKMNIGIIESLHEIPIHNSPQFKRIIIKVHWKLDTPQSQCIYNRLLENKSIKIVHDLPWYWICVKYTKQGTCTKQNNIDPALIKSFNESNLNCAL